MNTNDQLPVGWGKTGLLFKDFGIEITLCWYGPFGLFDIEKISVGEGSF